MLAKPLPDNPNPRDRMLRVGSGGTTTHLNPLRLRGPSARSTGGLPRASLRTLVAGQTDPRTAATEANGPLWSCAGSGPEKDLEGVSR